MMRVLNDLNPTFGEACIVAAARAATAYAAALVREHLERGAKAMEHVHIKVMLEPRLKEQAKVIADALRSSMIAALRALEVRIP